MFTLGLSLDTIPPRRAAATGPVAPVISAATLSTAEPRVGRVVSVSWTGQPRTGASYAWLRNGVAIPGASGASYTPVAADEGQALSCAVTVANGAGTAQRASEARRVLPATSPAVLLIVAGQSNARAASTSAANAPTKYLTLRNASMWVEGSGFAPYAAGGNSDGKGASGAWGSEAEFIYRVNQASADRAVYVVKEAVNGSTMASGGANSWTPTMGAGGRFAQLEAQVTGARAALAAAGVSFEEVTLLNQGESDTETDAGANGYRANFDAFLAAYRARISTGAFVIERIRPFAGELAQKTYNRTFKVREAQEGAAAASGLGIVSLDFAPENFAELHPGAAWAEGKGLRAHAWWAGTYPTTFGPIADAEPSNLSFASQAGVATGALVISDSVTIAGIGGNAPVSIVGGEYRVRNPDDTIWLDWTAAGGTIHPLQRLQLRVTAPPQAGGTASAAVTVGGVSATWSVTTAAAIQTREPETVAFLARVAALAGGAMDKPKADALDAFYAAARGESWWTKTRRLYVGGLSDAVAASIDLRDQTTALTQVGATGSVTWTAGAGWGTAGGSGRGLDMHFNPVADGARDSLALFIWCADYSATGGSSSAFDIQASDLSVRLRQNDVGNLQARVNAAGNQTKTGITGLAGFRCVSRTAATVTTFYGPEGTSLGVDAVPSAALSATAVYMFAPISGSTSGRRLQVAGIAEGLNSGEVLALRGALATLGAAFWLT